MQKSSRTYDLDVGHLSNQDKLANYSQSRRTQVIFRGGCKRQEYFIIDLLHCSVADSFLRVMTSFIAAASFMKISSIPFFTASFEVFDFITFGAKIHYQNSNLCSFATSNLLCPYSMHSHYFIGPCMANLPTRECNNSSQHCYEQHFAALIVIVIVESSLAYFN